MRKLPKEIQILKLFPYKIHKEDKVHQEEGIGKSQMKNVKNFKLPQTFILLFLSLHPMFLHFPLS